MGKVWHKRPLQEHKPRKARRAGKNAESKYLSAKQNRKLYPLRCRQGMGEVGTRNCCVLLTRLEEGEPESSLTDLKRSRKDNLQATKPKGKVKTKCCKCHKKDCTRCKQTRQLKCKAMPEAPASQLQDHTLEPRKRRLASLNAEAVNSLLFDREEKKPQHSLKVEGVQSKDQVKEPSTSKKGTETKKRCAETEVRGSQKKHNKCDVEGAGQVCLDSPTPRRLAGLNAAALLKLTSASSGAKRRSKTDCKPAGGTARSKQPHQHPHKHLPKSQQQPQPRAQQHVLQRCCSLCKKETYHREAIWEGTTAPHGFLRPGYQCQSIMGYPLKPVKEEKTEAEVNPYFCCSQDRSVEYCHRLALFLDQKPYTETDESSLPSIKGFLPTPHTLPHPALSIGPHPYPCYPGYYVHIAHHGASSPPLSTSPVPYRPSSVTPITLCPSRVQRPKLRPPNISHPSGIPHQAFCSSMGSCYGGEPCRIGDCAYRTVPPIQSRGCSFSTECSSCSRKIKMEDCPYSLEDHSTSIPVSPSLPLSVCPMPSMAPSTQAVPRLQTPLSNSGPSQGQLRVARECPQSAKRPSGSRSRARNPLSMCPHIKDDQLGLGRASGVGNKQQKVLRRRATNGWLPVGVPTEREVFVVGEDTTALRRCYDSVQRGDEVIHVRDTVLLRSGPRKKSLPYVAKISALWEDPESGEMMMSLFWYYRPEHTQGGRNPSMHCENEIFASRHQDENSVACIEDKCYVLTLAQYCRFCALMKRRREGLSKSSFMVPSSLEYAIPAHHCVPTNVDPELVFVCRHVYDFRYGRLLKNLQ